MGVVGQAVYNGTQNVIFTYDLIKDKCIGGFRDLDDTDICFICLPTPTISCRQDLSAIERFLSVLSVISYEGDVVIKSTVLPGSMCKFKDENPRLNLVHNPEFLTARTATEDFCTQKRILLSGKRIERTKKFYEHFCLKDPKCVISTYEDYHVTEWAKYVHNTILPIQLSYLNELHPHMSNFDAVMEAACSFGNLNKHYKVPGPDGEMGWGGACFPKDTEALYALTNSIVLGAAISINRKYRDERK